MTTGIIWVRGSALIRRKHLDPVDQRQFQVQQDHLGAVLDLAMGVRAGAKDEIQGLGPVARDMDLVGEVLPLERVECQLHVVGIVFDQQDLDLVVIHG